ncbi:membrane protein [Desulfuromonas versatilis]|uniref:Membrane protein n=1 Tax=Desulfuromonas versatilis TaxID=2802975 RepID=A0ABM8HQL4_9BACT|nr:CBS domain-containing protein [Desulfuromonas versatilis]BCR04099.1 membrane protein [Desulfuromonas versatilis]
MLKAKDIMTTEVYSVTLDTGLEELGRLFEEKNVNAMPVVDDQGRLQGIVTQTDLVEQDKPLHIPTVISIFDWVFYLESEKNFKDEVARITARTVGEICTREVVTCTPETPVSEVAALMVDHAAHLVPVVEEEKLVGVVARLDIIRSMGK